MPFNAGQKEAIFQRDASILVSAPAGSGKTKILVSRIIELLKEGYDISEFLVVTFTEAAGNEMKQRLSEELNALVTTPIDEQLKLHLEKQIQNLPYAYITNFHGFCNTLLMKYGYLIDIMPGFKINSDPVLIKQEVLDECIEQWVDNQEIAHFLELYFPGYHLEDFKSILMNVDNLSQSIQDFYGYVDDTYQKTYQSLSSHLEDWPLFNIVKAILSNELETAMNKLVELKIYCENNALNDFFENPYDDIKRLSKSTPFQSLYDYIQMCFEALDQSLSYDSLRDTLKIKPAPTYTMTWKDIDPKIKKGYSSLKPAVLSSFNKAVSTYLEDDVDDFIKRMLLSYEAIHQLFAKDQLLNQFQDAYQEKKRELNQLDFSDLERYTHKLLEPQYGVVDILYNRLKEIMVDEYQDTNQVQESLLQKIATYKDPSITMFMVGDMKQSIYRFRQADPQIFSNKYDTFSLSNEDCQKTKTKRIDLVFNYRSSKVVLDSINYIFNQIMDLQIGGLDYLLDESARLNYDYDGREKNKNQARKRFYNDTHLTTEVLIDIYDPASFLTKEQYEAHMVAQKIIQLKEQIKIEGKPIQYSDIAILMRSTPSFLTFKKVFDQYHIPSHIVLSQGLKSSNEVTNMIAFLNAINNPYNEIALMSVLRLPYTISHIDMNSIASLKQDNPKLSLYDLLKDNDQEEIKNFIEQFEALRQYNYTHSPFELLQEVYKVTDYPLFVSSLINGEQRKANLDLLLCIIEQLQQDTPYLKDVLYSLEHASDYAPAQLSSSSHEAVEFMTIHKSKGLEFPIVFVCNTHKQFNKQDSRERFIFDKQLGIAAKARRYVDVGDYKDVIVEYDNSYRSILARYQNDESVNEEMRILYVALTRASSKLILTGVLKDINEIKDIQDKLIANEDEDIYYRKEGKRILLTQNLRKTSNYLSWILASILRHPSIIKQCLYIDELRHNALKLKESKAHQNLPTDSTEHAMFSLSLTNDLDIEEAIPQSKEILDKQDIDLFNKYHFYEYPYDLEKKNVYAVTTLQNISDDHYIPYDLEQSESSLKASDRGTLIHLFLSHLTFKNDDVESIIQLLLKEELIDELGEKELMLYKNNLNAFIQSDYYKMISQATYIYKEKPFSFKDEDKIIHGIFDLVFIYNNQIYVLDYKTDRVDSKASDQQLIEHHFPQLNYYKSILEKTYHKEVQAIIYYLHIHKGVEF